MGLIDYDNLSRPTSFSNLITGDRKLLFDHVALDNQTTWVDLSDCVIEAKG